MEASTTSAKTSACRALVAPLVERTAPLIASCKLVRDPLAATASGDESSAMMRNRIVTNSFLLARRARPG
jgi:hypothetical protein